MLENVVYDLKTHHVDFHDTSITENTRGAYPIEFIRNAATTYFHPTSTCTMGTGAEAVVDPELRVRGIAGLRVADASVMPRITTGNTNAPTVMIGEKAAALIANR